MHWIPGKNGLKLSLHVRDKDEISQKFCATFPELRAVSEGWCDQGAKRIRVIVDRSGTIGVACRNPNRSNLLLWFPPVVQAVSSALACDRLRTSVRPLVAAMSEAAGRYGDPRIGSKSHRRA